MSRLPIPHIINTIKTKLGFDRAMTAPGEDVVDAVNKQSAEIDNLQAAAAYVEDGDTATQKTYTEGEFIVWKGSLYTINSGGIPLGNAITGHVTAVTGGGLNALLSSQSEMNNRLSHIYRFKFTSGSYAAGDIIPLVNDFGNDSKIYAENGQLKFSGHYIILLALNVFSKNTNNRSWIVISGTNTRKQMIAYGEYTNVSSTSLEEVLSGVAFSLTTNEAIQVNEGAGRDVSYAYVILLSIK